jgi:quinoprotein glucose dehydrogenase
MKRLPLIILLAIVIAACKNNNTTYNTWRATGGSKENIRYSTLTSIDTGNVKNLAVDYHKNE